MSQAVRLFHICRRLSEGATVTPASLQEELEVARATVFRDIAVLKDQLNAPIAWDAQAETFKLTQEQSAGARFMLPGMWMDAEQIYGMLTVINIASALDPGVAMRFSREYRGLLKKLINERDLATYGLDRKIVVDLPQPGPDAQKAMRVIGPALVLDSPVRIFATALGEHGGLLVVPTRLRLQTDGWWLDYAECVGGSEGSIALASIVGAHAQVSKDPDPDSEALSIV